MTPRTSPIVALMALASCAPGHRGATGNAPPTSADSALLSAAADSLEALERRIGMALPSDRSAADRAAITGSWADAEGRMQAVIARTPESPVREWLLGDVWHQGQRLNVPGAFDSAEAHLGRALAMDSTLLAARLSLARLYVNSGLELAPKAEYLLRGANPPPGSQDEITVHEGLAFALWYQGRRRDAAAEAAFVLARDPANQAMKLFSRTATTGIPK